MTSSTPNVRAIDHGHGVYRIACPFDIDGVVALYYIDAPEPALIDTGVTVTPAEHLEPALRAAGFDLRAVRHIFTTHGHWDHMGGHGAMRALAPHAVVYIHPADAYLLDRLEAHQFGYITYMPRLVGDLDELERVFAKMAANVVAPVSADHLILDGTTIDLGSGRVVRAIHTPGHSRGSASYFLEDSLTLFTGDALQGLGGGPGRLPLVFDDSRAYRATIARVAALAPARLCLGHAFLGLHEGSVASHVRVGSDVRVFLEESGQIAKAIEEATRRAVTHGDPGFLAVAREVLNALGRDLGVVVDAEGLNRRSIPTLHAFYREVTGAPTPV